jgi:hypothetical protein
MPRPRRDDVFGAVRRQVTQVLKRMSDEIQRRENELKHLAHQAETWRSVIGGSRHAASVRAPRARRARTARPAAKRGRPRSRVSWSEVLASVPQQFGVSEVLKHPGARAKGRAQIYAALGRWLSDKKVKRIATGRYEKVSGAARVSAARPKMARKVRRRRAAGAKRAVAMKRAARRSKRSKGA